MGRKVKNAIKIYQNYTYQFQYKENVLNEPIEVAHGIIRFSETVRIPMCRVSDKVHPITGHDPEGE
jgi:hypothetical protein